MWDLKVSSYPETARHGYEEWMKVQVDCQPSWPAPKPMFLSSADHEKWKTLPTAFDGCKWDANGTFCMWNGGCSHYQTAFNASLVDRTLGVCREPSYVAVRHGVNCDPRTLVPMKVPQGMYFAHFLDNVMPRLGRVLSNEPNSSKLLMYITSEYASHDTYDLLKGLGVEVTTQLPQQCHGKIVWACDSVPMDPLTMQIGARFLRRAVAKLANVPDSIPIPARLRVNGTAPSWAEVSCTKIYAARLKNTKNGRQVRNEAEVVRHLRSKYNFTIFEGGESLLQWFEAIQNGCLLAGSHGGALSHMFMLRQENNPMVLELDGYNKYHIFWVLASALRIPYAWLSFNGAVDITRLDGMLNKSAVWRAQVAL